MKKLCCCVIIAASLWGCGSTGDNTQQVADTVETPAASLREGTADVGFYTLFSLADAERILGEPARLSDSATSVVADTLIFQNTYTAIAADKKSGKTGNIYFMYEQYNDASTAHRLLAYYKTANEKNGAQTVTGIGDEAWFHTDGQNFYFIMARKGNKAIRMKVNKLTLIPLLMRSRR
ncbi:hypothetical protein [Polluticoccus soli]|uniref:hypothetical protein n=1 Tax=Polluticoccus soli TaxID=3034150 RepID=UPI0023E19336|nr:hypothetical protein [Flavipsychrobacter sp. JY13-12]